MNISFKLSLSMIVRDEADVLARCLKSVSSLVDEIIIVDTGSTDSTIEIANSYRAKVFNYDWNYDFSNARNFSLSKASGDWVLILDADEIIYCPSKEEMDKLLHVDGCEGYFLKIINILGTLPEVETGEDMAVRLFRNRPEFRFEGPIYEQVRQSIKQNKGESSLKIAPLKIYHDGFCPKMITKRNKIIRRIAVFQKALACSSFNPYLLYSLGCEYFLLEDFEKSLSLFLNTLEHSLDNYDYLPDVLIKSGLCLFKLGRLKEISELTSFSSKKAPLAFELLFLEGLAHLDNGNPIQAELSFRECIAKFPENISNPLALRKHQVYQRLGETYEARKSWEEAIKFYFLTASLRPGYLHPIKRLISIFRDCSPDNYIQDFLCFCPPITKFALLEKLVWTEETDAVIFLIAGLLQDILVSDPELGQILIVPRLKDLLDKKKAGSENLKIDLAISVTKSMLYVSLYKSGFLGNTSRICRETISCLIEILLWEDCSDN